MASLREVAKQAGVSLATASRVASGSTAVRPETRERVERAMRDLLYVTPRRSDEVGAIGLILPELENPVFPALAQAMERRATELGYAAIVCNTFASTEAEAAYVRMLLERGVEGMVFVACQLNDTSVDHGHYARMLEKGARLVVVNGGDGSVRAPAVGVDEHEAGRLATQHLLDLGHTRIGFVAGPAHVRPTQLKAAGREAALRRAGLEDGSLVAHGAFSVDGGRAALRELLGRAERPTAVICSSDLMAIGALQAAVEAGLRVPDDLSVVGFDGIEATGWTTPSLTTVAQPLTAIAEAAVDAAAALVERPERVLPDVAFRPTLRVGASTAPPR